MVKYTRCSVYGCGVRNLQFFHFPRNVQRAEKWRELAGNPTLYSIPLDKLHHKASVCKRHFTRDQFTNTKLDRLNLNAFPSLFLPSSSSVSPVERRTQELEVPANPPVVHYVVFPSVESSVIAPSIELTTVDNVCLGGVPTSPELCVGDPTSATFQCAGEPVGEVPVEAGSNEVPASFVLTEYCEPESGISLKDPTEEGSDIPIDGHYRYTLCRLCFSTLDVIMTDIFSVDNRCGYVIKEAIEDLLQFKVSKMDEYPQFICVSCLTKLTEFKEFKEKILKDKAVFEEALRKLKSSDGEEESLAGGAAEDSNGPEEVCPSDLVQLISFEASGEEIPVGVSGITPEVIKGEDGQVGDVLEQGQERMGEQYADLMAETSRDYGRSEDLCEADRMATNFEDPLMGAELEIRRELNTGVVRLDDPHMCPECGRRFKTRNHLAKHKKERHRTRSESGKRFGKPEDINGHSDHRAVECAQCGVPVKTGLPENMRTQAAPMKALLCAVCRKAFGEEVRLQSRAEMQSSRKFRGGGLEGDREFNVDIVVMKDYRPQRGKRPFVCRECGKSFQMCDILNRHMKLSHLSEKRFCCEHCNARFALKRCLLDHVKLHIRRVS